MKKKNKKQKKNRSGQKTTTQKPLPFSLARDQFGIKTEVHHYSSSSSSSSSF